MPRGYESIETPVHASEYENNLPTFHTASISKTYFSVTRQMTPYGFKILAEKKNVHNFWKTLLLNSHLAIQFRCNRQNAGHAGLSLSLT